MFLFALTLTLALLSLSIAAPSTQRIDASGGGIRADGTSLYPSFSSAASRQPGVILVSYPNQLQIFKRAIATRVPRGLGQPGVSPASPRVRLRS